MTDNKSIKKDSIISFVNLEIDRSVDSKMD